MRVSLRHVRRGERIPTPCSSLLNPHSQRTRVRRMMAEHAAQEKNFEGQALYANLGGPAAPPPLPRSKKERSAAATRRIGHDVAERAKFMTDIEWESVPVDDKHAFVKFMRQMLQEHPTALTEQQRRRYFETTMADVRDLDPQKTVRDEYERVKLGLPVHLKNPQQSLGVSRAVYDAADASLFEPDNVHKLENAMTHIKQIFADYVRKRRDGVGTEAERRQLANMTAELNLETQRHLASMFKYAEARLRQVTLDERHHQLTEIERLRRLALRKGSGCPRHQESRRKTGRVRRLARVLRRAVGLDMDVAKTVLTEMRAQEDFLQFCEVFARLTVGVGFHHGFPDEKLGTYVESLRKLYSMRAGTLATLDVVQYYASREATHPVDWAKRWYERALLLPLQSTPEYRQLVKIQGRENAVPKAVAMTTQQPSEAADPLASRAEIEAAHAKEKEVVNMVEKMFMDPSDKRVVSLHEKRLRYLAHVQMERQIERVRGNAKLFEGVELTLEAEQCRELYKKILERKMALRTPRSAVFPSGGGDGSVDAKAVDAEHEQSLFNVYDDTEAAALFEKIREITLDVIRRRRVESVAVAKMRSLHRVVRRLKGGECSAAEELQCLQQKRRARITQRLLGIVENDVKAEMEWLEGMEEAERPPLLPIPEGMSYVSVADVQAWRDIREDHERRAGNPFVQRRRTFQPELLGQAWRVPDRPLLFWGTGVAAVQQALRHAAEDAERKRHGAPLAPPYPCAENPWGWRLAKDVLDES